MAAGHTAGFPTLLYVEDDQPTRNRLVEALHRRYPQARIVVESSGEKGLESCAALPPDIVLTDVCMPRCDGITMAEGIRRLAPQAEIIALSGHSDTKYLLRAIELGIDHYLLKPCRLNRLFAIIDGAFEKIALQRSLASQRQQVMDLNRELTEKATLLEQANHDLECFNYMVAHDLRAPLVAAGTLLELVQREVQGLSHQNCRNLKIARNELARMNQMIGALLTLSCRPEHLTRVSVDLSGLAREIKDELMGRDPQRKVSFEIAAVVRGVGDPALLRIVLENLLSNAWKYTAGKKKGRIEFGCAGKGDSGRQVYFVLDNGSGFDQREAARLFGLFHRLPQEQHTEGFGIGLATVESIIHRHGGTIWAEGTPGRGAVFYFTLGEPEPAIRVPQGLLDHSLPQRG